MGRCQHKRVQDYTECCLDCGRNIWESDDEYEAKLDKRLQSQRIEEKERRLGITNDEY
jgi:hypothetical protein